MSNSVKTTETAGRIRYSISSKLNRKLFFRLLGLFVSIDLLILIITAVSLAVYCERKTLSALDILPELAERGEFTELSGIVVREIQEFTVNGSTDWPISRLLPYETETALRGFRFEDGDFSDSVGSITYVLNVVSGDKLYEISLRIGQFILYFKYAFGALLAVELLTLLSRSAKDRRMVRKTLEPISGLARAAQTLGDASRRLDHDTVMTLAGRLDGIDGSRPDTRIQLDGLQAELKNVAIAINGMLDRIVDAYAAQARFVSDASHELRTPIAVIQGYANLLDRWGTEDEKTLAESITAIKDEAENMKGLVEQLLFLARGDSNTIRLEEERIFLPEFIGEVVAETQMLDSSHVFNIKAGDIEIAADRSLIKQALRILVDNAVKYTDDGGMITVSADMDGNNTKLSVSDNGVGIAPEILPHVFNRFVRADESRARKTGGAGLGLSIAQWIATRHNGHIEALSREGVGTRMTIVLPAGNAAPPPERTESTIELTLNGQDG